MAYYELLGGLNFPRVFTSNLEVNVTPGLSLFTGMSSPGLTAGHNT